MSRTPAFRTPLGWLPACLLAVAGFCHPARAAQDVANSKDHPLLTRYPQSHIAEYEKNFNAVTFTVGPDKKQTVEGEATQIHYFHNDADKQPSALQLIRNYQNAIKAIGGEVIYERLPREGDGGETTLKVRANGKDHWIRVEPGIFSAPAQSYKLQLVEVAVMQQVVTANHVRATQNAKSKMADVMPDVRKKLDDWSAAANAIDTGGSLVSLYHQLAIFTHPDKAAGARTAEMFAEEAHKGALQLPAR